MKRPIEHLRLFSGIIGGLSERRIGNIGRFEMKWGDLTKEAHT